MSKKITDEDIEKAVVKLKPIWGISPGIYLTVFYGLVLSVLLFFFLFFPGLKKNGTDVYVDTFPPEAAVYVNDLYSGSTPVSVFIPKGNNIIRIEKKHFETVIVEKTFNGRIFGSLIFPIKLTLYQNLFLSDKKLFLKDRFEQLSSFALIEDFYDRYQMPPLISKTVAEYLAGTEDKTDEMLYSFLYSMRVNLGSPEMVSDYISAVKIVSSDSSSEDTDFSVLFNYFSNENNSDNLILSIIGAYPPQQRRDIIDILNEDYNLDSVLKISDEMFLNNFNEPSFSGKSLNLGNLRFISVKGGEFKAGVEIDGISNSVPDNQFLNNFPHLETVSDFFILEREITRGDYFLFLKENPEWKGDNIDYLIEKNLVTSDYLKNQDFSFPEVPISNISWFAADTYSNWLESKLPDNMKDFEIRLPKESEWEAAALLNETPSMIHITKESSVSSQIPVEFLRAGNVGLYDIIGNLWEWTDGWYFPGDTLNGKVGLVSEDWNGIEKAVRGGSWGNLKSEILISTRGSQNPAWCTPFTGFRPVVVKK